MSAGTDAAGHLARPALARILSGRAHRADARAAVRHLVALCPECAASSVEAAAGKDQRPSGELPANAYDATFASVLANASATEARMTEERLRGALQWAELEALPQAARRGRVARDEACHHPGFVAAAVERAEQLGQVAGRAGVAAAELAVTAAEHLAAAGRPSPALAADLAAAALGALGEARRRAGSLTAARQALLEARRKLELGTGEPLAAAELLRREARLAVELGEMNEALVCLDRAREIYVEIEDWPAAGRALLAIARVIGVADPQEALRRTDDALGLLDPADDPRADLRGFLQLGWYLVDTGRPQDAQVLLAIPQTDPEGRWGGEPERLLRLWLAARVARALGRPEEAAPAFAAVVAGWRSLGRLRPRAFASLEQIEALQAAGEAPAAEAVALALARALARQGFHAQGLGILEQLANSIARGQARHDVCSTLADYLLGAWHQPLPFPELEESGDARAADPAA
jgi:tetratricopeptide (TPR) repeat protein